MPFKKNFDQANVRHHRIGHRQTARRVGSPGHRVNDYTATLSTKEYSGPEICRGPTSRSTVVNGKLLIIMPWFDYANDLSLIFRAKNPARFYFDSFKAHLIVSTRRDKRVREAHRLSGARAYRRQTPTL